MAHGVLIDPVFFFPGHPLLPRNLPRSSRSIQRARERAVSPSLLHDARDKAVEISQPVDLECLAKLLHVPPDALEINP